MTAERERVLDVRQAAARAGRDPETIRRWIRTGRLAASRAGTKWMVRAENLDTLLPSGRPPLTLAEWYERVLARLPESRSGDGQPGVNLVIEERRARADKVYEDHIRRVEKQQ